MSKQSAAGIQNILDGILSLESRRTSISPQEVAAGSSSIHTAPANKTSEEQRPPPTGARRGRPVGKPAAVAPPKTKVTLWLGSVLVASYRDWSWEARSQFSHLVEKALMDYYQRQRNPGPARQ